MNSVTIREFIPADSADDKNTLLSAFLETWNATENLQYLSFTLKPFGEDTVRTWLGTHKEQGVRYFCAVREEGDILGIVVVKDNPVDGFELYGVGVRPDFQRKGIGRKLIEHVIHLAETLGFKDVGSSVFADNAVMLRLLISFHFVLVGMEYHKRADGADIVHMKLYL